MDKDRARRNRLKKKVLERWENEGGRLLDDRGKAPGADQPGSGLKDVPKDTPAGPVPGTTLKPNVASVRKRDRPKD